MYAYLLKSRIRRRRAGVDILIEHYFNVLSKWVAEGFIWLESLSFTIWLSAIHLVSSPNAAYLLENAMIACAFFCCFNLQTNEKENSLELYMLLQRITITSNVRTKSINKNPFTLLQLQWLCCKLYSIRFSRIPYVKRKEKGRKNKQISERQLKNKLTKNRLSMLITEVLVFIRYKSYWLRGRKLDKKFRGHWYTQISSKTLNFLTL